MMQADWTKTAQTGAGNVAKSETPEPRGLVPPPARNENRSPEQARRQPLWPLLVIAFGLLASVGWTGLLAWLILRW